MQIKCTGVSWGPFKNKCRDQGSMRGKLGYRGNQSLNTAQSFLKFGEIKVRHLLCK